MTRLAWQAYLGMEDPSLSYKGIKGYDEAAARANEKNHKDAAEKRPHTGGDDAYMTADDAKMYNVLGEAAFKRYKAAVKNLKE